MAKRYWICIIGPVDDVRLPKNGFDSVPREAAIAAIEKAGVEVKHCWSGWGLKPKKFAKIMKLWNKE